MKKQRIRECTLMASVAMVWNDRYQHQQKNMKSTGVHNGMGVEGWLEWSKVCYWGGWVG